MKRSALARRTALRRKTPIARRAKRRLGLTGDALISLKELFREVVMLRHGADEFTRPPKKDGTPRPSSWRGACAHCGKYRILFVCHIETQGRASHLKYDLENVWPGCFWCHIRWWHTVPAFPDANGLTPEQWIEQRMGKARREALRMRAKLTTRRDLGLLRVMLEQERKKLRRF